MIDRSITGNRTFFPIDLFGFVVYLLADGVWQDSPIFVIVWLHCGLFSSFGVAANANTEHLMQCR